MVMEYPAATEDRGFAESVVLTGVQFLLANDGTLCVPWREADCGVSKRMSEEGAWTGGVVHRKLKRQRLNHDSLKHSQDLGYDC